MGAQGKPEDKCVTPAKGPILPEESDALASDAARKIGAEEVGMKVLAKVGGKAPDFEASAYLDGGFRNIRLSDYRGKWVVLCFYPGDFTFV